MKPWGDIRWITQRGTICIAVHSLPSMPSTYSLSPALSSYQSYKSHTKRPAILIYWLSVWEIMSTGVLQLNEGRRCTAVPELPGGNVPDKCKHCRSSAKGCDVIRRCILHPSKPLFSVGFIIGLDSSWIKLEIPLKGTLHFNKQFVIVFVYLLSVFIIPQFIFVYLGTMLA